MICNGRRETTEPSSLDVVARCWALAFARGVCPSCFVKAVCDSSVPEDLSEHCFCESHRKHEWDKHGTCAAQVDALNSEKKYFGKSLDLYKQIDLNRWAHTSLQAAGNACRAPLPTASHVWPLNVVWWAHCWKGVEPLITLTTLDYDHRMQAQA